MKSFLIFLFGFGYLLLLVFLILGPRKKDKGFVSFRCRICRHKLKTNKEYVSEIASDLLAYPQVSCLKCSASLRDPVEKTSFFKRHRRKAEKLAKNRQRAAEYNASLEKITEEDERKIIPLKGLFDDQHKQ